MGKAAQVPASVAVPFFEDFWDFAVFSRREPERFGFRDWQPVYQEAGMRLSRLSSFLKGTARNEIS
jgi:hypothetical protein